MSDHTGNNHIDDEPENDLYRLLQARLRDAEEAKVAAERLARDAYPAGVAYALNGAPRTLLDALRWGEPGDTFTVTIGSTPVTCVLGHDETTAAAPTRVWDAIRRAYNAHTTDDCDGLRVAAIPHIAAIAWTIDGRRRYVASEHVTPVQRRTAVCILRKTLRHACATVPLIAALRWTTRTAVATAAVAAMPPMTNAAHITTTPEHNRPPPRPAASDPPPVPDPPDVTVLPPRPATSARPPRQRPSSAPRTPRPTPSDEPRPTTLPAPESTNAPSKPSAPPRATRPPRRHTPGPHPPPKAPEASTGASAGGIDLEDLDGR